MGKIKRQKAPGGGKIPPPALPPTPHLTVSFKHFNHRDPFVFPMGQDKPNYPRVLFERLRNLCQMKPSELRAGNNKALRCHQIDWDGTTEPAGFEHLHKDLREQVVAWQFTISANEYGRIHGFWIDDVFYIVWIDPYHKLYA